MSLRLKILLVFALAFTVLYAIIVVVAEVFVEREFLAIEMVAMDRVANRFAVEMGREVYPAISAAGDWGPWDETLAFASGEDPGFIARNLTGRELLNLRLDFLGIWSASGELLAFETVEPPFGEGGLDPASVAAALEAERIVEASGRGEPVSGAIRAGEWIVLVAAQPVLPSNREGVPAGTLVAGRVLAGGLLAGFEESSGYRLRFLVRDREPHTPAELPEGNRPIAPFPPVVSAADNWQLVAVVPVADVCGQIVADAELSSLRSLRPQVDRTVAIIKVVLAASGAILLFIIWFVMDTGLVNPIRQLSAQFEQASAARELPAKLDVSGGGEIAALARRIQSLLRVVRETEASYRAVVEDQTELIFRYGPDFRITFANGAYARYLGVQVGRLVGQDIFGEVDPHDLPAVRRKIVALTPDQPVVSHEHRIVREDGSCAWLSRTDHLIASDPAAATYQCVARDITDSKRAERQLVDSEQRFRSLFETARDAIVIMVEATGAIADANPQFCAMVGLAGDELVGRPLGVLAAFRNPSARASLPLLAEAAARGARLEMALDRPDGGRDAFEVEVFASELAVEGERLIQLNIRDISRRTRAETELRKLSGRLLRLQDDERRRIARELHDSTAQNLSALELALDRLAATVPGCGSGAGAGIFGQIRALAGACTREIRTLSYLLHPPLLDEAGLSFALQWYVDGFMSRTEIVVHLRVPDAMHRLSPEVETTLFRIVQEALGNIHRHSGSRRAWIVLELDKDEVRLEIRDEGRGIDPEKLAALVERNAMVGVGVAGMRERVRHLGGKLFIDSPGRGVTIRVSIPVSTPDVAA